jgi:tRNA pseudouridine55 synthase
MDEPKQYEATVKLGATTPTDDPESTETVTDGAGPVAVEAVRDGLSKQVGDIRQRPPAFSALKVGGRRAYDLARGGKTVELEARIVRVYAIEMLSYAWPLVRIRVDCGRGTYIRAIARDLGEALGVGGYLTELRRTRVGPFGATHASTLEQLAQPADVERAIKRVDVCADAAGGSTIRVVEGEPKSWPTH